MSEHLEVSRSLDGERLDRALSLLWSIPRTEAADLIASNKVLISGRVVRTKSYRLSEGDNVELTEAPYRPERLPQAEPNSLIDLVYFDEYFAVVNKRAGQVVHPGSGVTDGTMVSAMLGRFPTMVSLGERERPGVVHRLDKGTSGLMLFGLEEMAFEALKSSVAAREVSRTYIALVSGHLEASRGRIDAPISRSRRDPRKMEVSDEGKEAESLYQLLERFEEPYPASLVEVTLLTGRTHQIRVHMTAIGHPIIGDGIYGSKIGSELERPFLHSYRLAFHHPRWGSELEFHSELPLELTEALGGFH